MSSPRRVKYKINKANTELLTTMNAYLIKSNKRQSQNYGRSVKIIMKKSLRAFMSVNIKKFCLPLV